MKEEEGKPTAGSDEKLWVEERFARALPRQSAWMEGRKQPGCPQPANGRALGFKGYGGMRLPYVTGL